MPSRRSFLKGLLGSAALLIGTGGYAFGIEPAFRLETRHYRLSPRMWPSDLALKIAVVADVHAGEPDMSPSRVGMIVDRTNALGADVIVLLGDHIASHRFQTRRVSIAELAPVLARLSAPLGVYSILGNHDWWDDDDAQSRGSGPTVTAQILPKHGVPVLENDVVRLEKNGAAFWIAGLGDQWAFLRGRNRTEGVDDLPGTLAKIEDDAPIILLAHEPDIFQSVPERVALTLSGHTHGGQVRLFGFSPNVPSRYGNRYAYGHVVEEGRNLIVSGGLGCSGLPVRFGVPPEILLIELTAA